MCHSQVSGRTKSAEAGQKTRDVNMFYTQPLSQIAVLGTFPEINVTQIMAVDLQTSDARFVSIDDDFYNPEFICVALIYFLQCFDTVG